MSHIPFLVDDQGLNTPRLIEARELIVELWRARFGENAYTTSDTPDGLIIDSLSIILDLLWQANGQLWADSFFRTADGNSLDLLLDLLGKTRLDADASTVSTVFYGTDTTAIPLASVVTVNDTQDRFDTDAAAVIGAGDLVFVARIESTIDDTYRVTINGTDFDEVSTTQTIIQIRDALIVTINLGAEPVTAISGGVDSDGFGLIVVDADDGETAMTFATSVLGAGTIDDFEATRVGMSSLVLDAIQAFAGTLQTLETAISGVEGVTTTADATLGMFRETDSAFRIRHLDTLQAGGSATDKAIQAKLVLDVDGVIQARVFSNRDDVVDAAGRDPHSVEAVVLGGDDTEIAQLLFDNTPSGIAWFGTITVVITDVEGGTHAVKFSRPTVRFAHIELTITQGENYPTTGDPETTIAQAVAAHFSTTGDEALTMGKDVYRVQASAAAVAAVVGISNVVVRMDDTPLATDPPTFVDADIDVADNEIAQVDTTRIVVIGA